MYNYRWRAVNVGWAAVTRGFSGNAKSFSRCRSCTKFHSYNMCRKVRSGVKGRRTRSVEECTDSRLAATDVLHMCAKLQLARSRRA